VDPATYLPMRYLATFGPPVFKAHGTIQADFRWLRPTRANLAAAFNVPIRPDSSRSRRPADDREKLPHGQKRPADPPHLCGGL
jgi:hypothetical protein